LVRRVVEEIVGIPAERGVDPMECVAIGAAIQGGVLAGEIRDLLLLDVTPLSLGVETLGGIFTKIIERNTTIPVRRSQIFTTAEDFQTTVTIHVLQGERPMAADNLSLGKFNLVGIPPAPRGVPQIEVTFDIDANGILHVSARDLATGKEQKITITSSMKLSPEEKERMIREAEQFAEQDRKRREEAELRNQAESLIYTAERMKRDLKLSEDQVKRIEKGVEELRKALQGKDVGKIKASSEALSKVLQEVGMAAYQQAAQRSVGERRVVDADYRVVDEDKK